MSHEAHHGAAHSTENKPKTSLNSSFWFVLILVLLFVAAINFISEMGHSEGHEGGHEATHTEHAAGGHGTEHGATPATGHQAEGHAAETPAADTAHAAAHH